MDTNLGNAYKRLRNGEAVKCFACAKGEYKSLSEGEKCCHYKCNICGDMIRGEKN